MLIWTKWIPFSLLVTVGVQGGQDNMQMVRWEVGHEFGSLAWRSYASWYTGANVFCPFSIFLVFASSAKISTGLRRRLDSREIFRITGTFLKGSSWNDLTLTLFKAKLCIFILSWKGSLGYAPCSYEIDSNMCNEPVLSFTTLWTQVFYT